MWGKHQDNAFSDNSMKREDVVKQSQWYCDRTKNILQDKTKGEWQQMYFHLSICCQIGEMLWGRLCGCTSRSLRSMWLLEVSSSSSPLFSLTSMACISASHSLLWWLIMMSICLISSWSSGSHDDRTELKSGFRRDSREASILLKAILTVDPSLVNNFGRTGSVDTFNLPQVSYMLS